MGSAPAPAPVKAAPKPSSRPVFPDKRYRLRFALVVFLLLVGVSYVPVEHHLRAASLLTSIANPDDQSWLARLGTNPVTEQEFTITSGSAEIPARLYRPIGVSHPAPIVVVHGVHHLGIDEPRLMAFAHALASRGFLVLTPYDADLADYQVNPNAADTIGAAAHQLRQISGAPKVAVLGLSFAGGMALMADANPRYADDIGVVCAIGSHSNIERVLRYFATNRSEGPDNESFTHPAHEYGPLVAIYEHPEALFPAKDVKQVRVTLRYLLWEDVFRSRQEAAKLSPKSQRTMEILYDHQKDSVTPALLKYLDQHRTELLASSPEPTLSRVRVPVYLLAGAADNIVPPTETLWIEHDLSPQVERHVLISPVLSHLDVGKATLANRLELVHWMSKMLDGCEETRSTVY